MRTQGPRMNPARTREVVTALSIPIARSSAIDIEIHRTLPGALEPEVWRLRTSGGIVADADQVWLLPVLYRLPPGTPFPSPKSAQYADRGPYWNKTQLAGALRAWRRGA